MLTDIKQAVCAKQNSSFAETNAHTLAQETAKVISRPQSYNVQKLEVASEGVNIVEDIK